MNFASLPMYDLPELASATSAWWAGLAVHMQRQGIGDVPEVCTTPDDLERHWCSPNLLFSQTCGYPLTHQLNGKVRLLGLPVYACKGCDRDGFYSSVIVVPGSSNLFSLADCRSARAVYNTDDSMSGLLALRAAAASQYDQADPFFRSLSRSGGHRRSLRSVADGKADVACIDAVTFALLSRIEPKLVSRVRVLGQSPKVPGLPYITSLTVNTETVERLRTAIRQAMADPALSDVRAELLLSGITFPDPAHYNVILDLEAAASRLTLA
ncbi:MAG: PhnD/SsuA/transferrin family substrate-binding protein [Pseudomonadota bacterium]